MLDVTRAVKPGQPNRLAVRVLNPTYAPIDGIALKQTASRQKQYPVATNSMYNSGGIVERWNCCWCQAFGSRTCTCCPTGKAASFASA